MADPRFKFQIPILTVDAFCAFVGYSPTIPDPANPGATLPNPETKNFFVARKIREYVEGNAASGKIISVVNTRKTEDANLAASVAIIVPVEIT